MRHPTVLLLTVDPVVMISAASSIHRAGYTVAPGRPSELAVDAITRVRPEIALVQIGHHAAESITFLAVAEHLGTRVILLSMASADPAYRAAVAMISARSRFPVVEVQPDGRELLSLLEGRAAA